MFIVGKTYSRKDIYQVLNVPQNLQGGNWNTGYTQYGNEYYVFANIGVSGRVGENHHNILLNNKLEWYAKKNSHMHQATILRMISNDVSVHIFTRLDNKNVNFSYQGVGYATNILNVTPVKVTWLLNNQ